MSRVLRGREETFERPAGFDVLAAVLTSLGSLPREYPLEVVVHTTAEHTRRRISAEMATLEELPGGGGVLLRGYTHDPDWMAWMLVSLGCRIEIRQPEELRSALRRHAAAILEWVG